MLKKIILTISFVAVFFYQAPLVSPKILAASDSGLETAFENIWQAILSVFYPLLAPAKLDSTTESYISSQDSKQGFTDYTKKDKDWSLRTLPESLKKQLIGIWFNEVITKPGLFTEQAYSDEIISEPEGDCPQIKISDIVYFYSTKTDQKILYARDNSSPIGYPLIFSHTNDIGPDKCYINAYEGIRAVPKGLFQGKGDADLSSTQYNMQLRHILSQDLQDEPVLDNTSAEDTKKTVEFANQQLKRVRAFYMPQNIKNMTDCSNKKTDEEKNLELEKNMQKSLKDQKWIAKEKTTDTSSKEYQKGTDISNCSPGSGLSQYGARGMAMKGYKYDEILTAYYGIGNSGFDFGKVNSSEDKITVKLYVDTDNCDELVNEDSERFKFGSEFEGKRTLILTVEDYLLGITEIPEPDINDWSVDSQEALYVAARSFAYGRTQNLTVPITNTSATQNFGCGRLLSHLHVVDNQTNAVKLTTGMVITKDGSVYEAPYLRCFGTVSSTYPKFDGTSYENLAGVTDNQKNKGTCNDYVTLPKITGTASAVSALYIFPNSSVHKARIAEDYDLAETSDSQYLQTYSGNCKLDTRISFGLNLMIDAAKTTIPNLNIKLISCYRSYAEQDAKWKATLKEYNGDETEAAKHTARPGKSAHQTGRAIDFGDPGALDTSSSFYKWLVANASKYGFYPYSEEAWHWEYNP